MAKLRARDQLIWAYIETLRLSAIKVMVERPDAENCWLRLEPDADLIEKDGPRALFDTFWFSKAGHAEIVFHQCVTIFSPEEQDVEVALPAQHMRDHVANQAALLGAPWRSTKEIVDAANEAVDEVEKQVAALNVSGGLGPFNSGYKSYRLAMQSTGEPALNYSAYLLRFKVSIVKKVAENVAAGIDKFAGLLSVVPGEYGANSRAATYCDSPRSNRVYPNRSWSNHSFRKS